MTDACLDTCIRKWLFSRYVQPNHSIHLLVGRREITTSTLLDGLLQLRELDIVRHKLCPILVDLLIAHEQGNHGVHPSVSAGPSPCETSRLFAARSLLRRLVLDGDAGIAKQRRHHHPGQQIRDIDHIEGNDGQHDREDLEGRLSGAVQAERGEEEDLIATVAEQRALLTVERVEPEVDVQPTDQRSDAGAPHDARPGQRVVLPKGRRCEGDLERGQEAATHGHRGRHAPLGLQPLEVLHDRLLAHVDVEEFVGELAHRLRLQKVQPEAEDREHREVEAEADGEHDVGLGGTQRRRRVVEGHRQRRRQRQHEDRVGVVVRRRVLGAERVGDPRRHPLQIHAQPDPEAVEVVVRVEAVGASCRRRPGIQHMVVLMLLLACPESRPDMPHRVIRSTDCDRRQQQHKKDGRMREEEPH